MLKRSHPLQAQEISLVCVAKPRRHLSAIFILFLLQLYFVKSQNNLSFISLAEKHRRFSLPGKAPTFIASVLLLQVRAGAFSFPCSLFISVYRSVSAHSGSQAHIGSAPRLLYLLWPCPADITLCWHVGRWGWQHFKIIQLSVSEWDRAKNTGLGT